MQVADLSFSLTVDGKQFQVGLRDAGQLLRQFQKNADESAKSLRRLEENAFSLSTKFRNLILTLGNLRFALLDVYDVFIRMPVAIVRTAGEMEKLRTQLEGLSNELGEAQKKAAAAADFKFLTNMAQNAPFELQALADTFVKLKSGGIDPTRGAMQALVDTVAKFGGSSEQLKRAGVAIQQILGKGVVSMEELRQQLGEAIPTVVRDLADAMRITMPELIKLVSSGQVESTSAMNKLIAQLIINNEGAAAKFRQTWVGTFAAFKTQLQLAADEIGQGGFLQVVKDVTNSLTEALQGADFKSFSVNASQDLAQVVEVLQKMLKVLGEAATVVGPFLKDIAQGIGSFFSVIGQVADFFAGLAGTTMNWGKALGVLVSGFIAMKVVTGFIAPLADSFRRMKESAVEAAAQVDKSAIDIARSQRLARIESLEGDRELARERMMQLTSWENQQRASLRRVEQEAERHQQKLLGIQRQLARVPGPNGSGALTDPNFARRSALEEQWQRETQRARDLTSVLDAQRNALLATATQKERLAAQTERTSRTINQLSEAIDRSTARTRFAAGAKRFLGEAMDFVGGKIGLAIIAITALVMWWDRLKRAQEDAAEAALRAAEGVSTASDLVDAKKRLREAEQGFEAEQAFIAGRDPSQLTERQIANYNAAAKRLEEMQKLVIKMEQNLQDQAREQSARAAIRDVERQVAIKKDEWEKKIQADREALATLRSLGRAYTKDEEREIQERNQRVNALTLASFREQLDIVERALAENREKLRRAGDDQVAAGAALSTIERLQDLGTQLRNTYTSLLAPLNQVNNLISNKKTDSDGSSTAPTKFENFVARLVEQEAELKAVLPGLVATLNEADEVAKARAEVMAKFQSGQWNQTRDGKPVGPGQNQVNEAANRAANVARMEQAKKFLEQMNDIGRSIGPEVKAAQKFFQDPFALADSSTPESDRFDKLIATIGKDANEAATRIAQATGANVDVVREKINALKKDLASVDLAAAGRVVVDQNEALSDELIEDDRERANRRLLIDNAMTQEMIANAIARAQAEGVSQAEIDRLVALAEQRNQLTFRKLREGSKTPFEQMLDGWRNTTKQMEQATVSWAQRGMDAITDLMMTGKLNFRELAESIIKDLIRIQMQASIAKLGQYLFGGPYMGMGLGGGTPPGGLNTYGPGAVPAFANGGIMTKFGPAPLRKYAAGGIANSPQLALFGEGSTPEAFVPLPDGRTIPVTVKASGEGDAQHKGGSVVVNVINQTSQAVNATQSQPRWDGKKMILDVVLSAASTPGPFRDGMRTMMGVR